MPIEQKLELTPIPRNLLERHKKSKPYMPGDPVTRQAPPAGIYIPQPYPTEPASPAQPDI